ncbi:uncharacterized protein LOC135401329 isoform X2 [Ornithodoros turicata]|uniref:uncharacterized protein LOC135401329 isoform X2 n=1 Tax=Ornithodoros turicata TaxID=34597 RepID=UPI003139A13B
MSSTPARDTTILTIIFLFAVVGAVLVYYFIGGHSGAVKGKENNTEPEGGKTRSCPCPEKTPRTDTSKGVWAVKESNNSDMHEWRPYQVYFVGDENYKLMQESGEFIKFAEGLLAQATIRMNNVALQCPAKLLVVGTTVFTQEQEQKYLRSGAAAPNLTGFLAEDEMARTADIVIALSSAEVKGVDISDAQEENSLCTKDKFIVANTLPWNYYMMDERILTALIRLMGFPGHPCIERPPSCCGLMQDLYKKALAGEKGAQCYNTNLTCCHPTTFELYRMSPSTQCIMMAGTTTYFQATEEGDQCFINCTASGGYDLVDGRATDYILPDGASCKDDRRFPVCLDGRCSLPYDEMMDTLYSIWNMNSSASLPACQLQLASLQVLQDILL